MNRTDSRPRDERTPDSYEAPRLETVLTPEEVEREVHYAGEVTPADATAP